MEAQEIPESIQESYPSFKKIDMGPPAGVAEEDCYTLQVLAGQVSEGVFDGAAMFRSYWKPSEVELDIIKNGGYIELVLIGIFPPVIVGVTDG